MYKNGKKIAVLVTIICVFMLVILSCDDFQSKSFDISSLDATACEQLSDSLSDSVSTVNLINIDTTWEHGLVVANVDEILDSLETRNIVVTAAGADFTLFTLVAEDTNYLALNPTQNEIVFFFDESVDMNIISEDGDIIGKSKTNMPYETAGGCMKERGELLVPRIKTRIEYNVPDSRYLLQLIKDDQTGDEVINVSILRK